MTAGVPGDELLHSRKRHPAVVVACAFVLGIAVDRWSTLAWSTWLIVGSLSVALWLTAFVWHRNRLSALCLLISCVCVGGVRHHLFWSVAQPDDLSTVVTDEFQLVRLRGVVISQPSIRQADQAEWQTAVPQIDQSRCIVESHSMSTNDGWVAVSGRIRLTVQGHLLHVDSGDDVEIFGWISLPRLPGNPGQFDFKDYLRRQNCRCLLSANHPDAVQTLRKGGRHSPTRMLARFREKAELLCWTHLSESNFAVASALLLGNRSMLTNGIRAGFAESGTMHILAISGLHVGILAALLWCGCRFLNCSVLWSAAVIVGGIAIYTIISGGRPPVLLAGIFILIAVVGNIFKRQTSSKNTLALSVMIVLAWNPSDLFDVGA